MPIAHAFPPAPYPLLRHRRVRMADWSRRLVRETSLTRDDLIWPLFVIEGTGREEPVRSMPGVSRLSVDGIVAAAHRAADLGIPAIAIFPVIEPGLKDPDGSVALHPENLVCRAVAEVRAALPTIGIICDAALDPFTSHGHDGIVRDGHVINDVTVERLVTQSLNQVAAGCSAIAPSDMMDGRVGAIRAALENAGHHDTVIISYAAKYASGFYGPFREALGSGADLGPHGKKTYQMDPANSEEALREVASDLAEGADMVMVKPGMPYLDIIQRVKATFGMPTLAYQVSGEYAMLRSAVDAGYLDSNRVILESLAGFKRAGADAILTYFAPEVAAALAKS